jgi:Flp pilus assembly protein TadG
MARITRTTLRTTHRRGGILVEAALILPILISVIFGLIEYGWMFLKAQQIALAARDGARAGSLSGNTGANVTSAVDSRMTQAGITSGQYTLTVSPAPETLARGQTFTVTISANYGQTSGGLTILHLPLIPVPDRLSSSFTIAREGP